MKRFWILLFLLYNAAAYSQQGDYLITNHKPDINNIDNTNFQIIQDNHGLMYFANRSGVLVYDGKEWDFYSTPGAVLSMAFGPKGDLFVGCLNDFGKISYEDNSVRYVSMSGQFGKSFGMIYQVISFNDRIIFTGEKLLYIYDEKSAGITTHAIEDEENYYNLLFTSGSELYANISDGSINRLDKNFKPDSTFTLPDASNLAFIRKNSETGVIIAGSINSNIFQIGQGRIEMLPYSYYFTSKNVQIVDGYWYDNKKFVVGTLEKGCFIMDLSNPSIPMDTIDFNNGLPDNEVSALFVDNSHGIWVSNEFGLARISPEIPVRSYSHYPGLQGNLLSLQNFNNHLYVSTSVGVYYLDELKKYKRTVYYVRKTAEPRAEKKPARVTENKEPAPVVEQENQKSQRKRFLGFIRIKGKKTDEQKKEKNLETEVAEENTEEVSKPGLIRRLFSKKEKPSNEIEKIKGIPLNNKEYVRKIRKDLQSVQYAYKPVEGIQAKCKQLIIFGNKLLAVSNSGVFEINDTSATIIINEPARFLYSDKINDRIILCGYDRTVKVFKHVGDIWAELHDELFNEIITNIGMDKNNTLWLAGPRLLYKIKLTDEEFNIEGTFPFSNQLIDIPVMAAINDRFYFIYSMGYYYYDGDTIREDKAFKDALGLPVEYNQSPDGNVWIFNGKIWNRINQDGKIEPFDYLSLFPDIKLLVYDSLRESFGILTTDNNIYFYKHSATYDFQPLNDLILKRITTNNGEMAVNSRITLSYKDNSLSFKFSEPDYLGFLKVEYQYKLEEEMKVWSEWSPFNSVNFSYLQPGKYLLRVRARDAFGRMKDSETILFKVMAPYWKQPWFYALEILFFSALIFIVKRLRRLHIRYPFIADAMAILTLIMIIAFIQSTIQQYLMIKSTPVMDFVINVVVAIIAFPLEQKLRKILT
jgi:hypothetical protein